MQQRTYKNQFPDFDTVPAMLNWSGPSTWIDCSWHNDICPCAISEDLIPDQLVRVWTEYSEPSMREDIDGYQYMIHAYTLDDEPLDILLETNSLEILENHIRLLERQYS